jgi:hypothetical protein
MAKEIDSVWIHAEEFNQYTKGWKAEQVGSLIFTVMRLALRGVPDLDKEFPFLTTRDPYTVAEGVHSDQKTVGA